MNGLLERSRIFSTPPFGKPVTFGPHTWTELGCSTLRYPCGSLRFTHVTRTNVSSPSVTFSNEPFELSWNVASHPSCEPGHTTAPILKVGLAVDHTPGECSNQSSGRDLSTDCWNTGLGPFP